MANSEDPDEMPHSAAFHQGLHCLLKKNPFFTERNITSDLAIFTMDHPDLHVAVSNFMGNSIGLYKVIVSLLVLIFQLRYVLSITSQYSF